MSEIYVLSVVLVLVGGRPLDCAMMESFKLALETAAAEDLSSMILDDSEFTDERLNRPSLKMKIVQWVTTARTASNTVRVHVADEAFADILTQVRLMDERGELFKKHHHHGVVPEN